MMEEMTDIQGTGIVIDLPLDATGALLEAELRAGTEAGEVALEAFPEALWVTAAGVVEYAAAHLPWRSRGLVEAYIWHRDLRSASHFL